MARRGLGDEAIAGAIHKLNAVPSSSAAGEDKAKTAALALAAGTPLEYHRYIEIGLHENSENSFSLIILVHHSPTNCVLFEAENSRFFKLGFKKLLFSAVSTIRVIFFLSVPTVWSFASARRGRGRRVAVRLSRTRTR
jgi:hypothetical protein